LVEYLKNAGYWVRGVDIKTNQFRPSRADEFLQLDLRYPEACRESLQVSGGFDEVYQLAADMGGLGFIHAAQCDIMHNNILMNVHMTDAAARRRIPRYFFSSSVCVYRDMAKGEPEMDEDAAIPAHPDNEYGWEKLYSEILAQTYARSYSMNVRIARFQNCYGRYGAWQGGREKAPAAICRKVALADEGGTVEIWGDGSAVRSFTHVDDIVNGIYLLMHSELGRPVNIGSPEYVTVDELVRTIADIAGKRVLIKRVDGPSGVRSRNFSNALIYSLGWRPQIVLRDGLADLYPWISEQISLWRAEGTANQ
jgi:nucleoside-diphosphate-sugar epimerase